MANILDITDKKLAGDARLLAMTSFQSELVSLAVVFHVGFAHEEREHLGISHMVEHLCFSDNATRTFPEFRSAVEELGGVFNAHTQNTVTIFTLEVLKDYWREGLALLRDITMNPQFKAAACLREAKVLLAETGQFRQRWLAWFYERGWFRTYGVLLQDCIWAKGMHAQKTFHRYSELPSEALKAWHERYYRPENMAVVAAGPVDSTEVGELAEELFGSLPDATHAPLQHPEPRASTEETHIATRLGVPFWNQSMVAVGAWNLGSVGGEKALCDVLQEHLRNRAFDYLRVEHSLAYQTWCYFDGRRESGHLLLGANVKRGNEDRARKLLEDILERSLANGMSESELKALRNKLLARHARMNANPGWYAYELARAAFAEYAVDMKDYPDQLRKVTPTRVCEVLTRLLGERGRIIVRQAPLLSVSATVSIVAATLLIAVILVVRMLVQ